MVLSKISDVITSLYLAYKFFKMSEHYLGISYGHFLSNSMNKNIIYQQQQL